jgi:hypothetical protein
MTYCRETRDKKNAVRVRVKAESVRELATPDIVLSRESLFIAEDNFKFF